MKKIRWNPRLVTSLFITLLMCTLDCLAQEVIKGFVKDGNDEPLPGVSVAVKGATNVGTITNVDGKYSINAHKNDVLVFSYIGMVSQEVKVGNKTNINITLKEDVSSLDEIVVVGYGTQKRGSLTAAISTVSDKETLKPQSWESVISRCTCCRYFRRTSQWTTRCGIMPPYPYAGKVVLSMLLTASEEAQVTSTDSIRMK